MADEPEDGIELTQLESFATDGDSFRFRTASVEDQIKLDRYRRGKAQRMRFIRLGMTRRV